MTCKRCIVHGRVQGVWFRDATRNKAVELGLAGSAVNLRDGSVEVIVCGGDGAVASLCDWLWEGSPMSQVEAVECESWSGGRPSGFWVG